MNSSTDLLGSSKIQQVTWLYTETLWKFDELRSEAVELELKKNDTKKMQKATTNLVLV